MLVRTLFSGFGGQGVMSMGLTLTQAVMLEGRYVTYLPSYGAEVRGGTANCTVSISDEEIASPVTSSPTFLVAMNQPSVVRFQNMIESGGQFFINSTLVSIEISRGDIEIVKVPANAIADKLGNLKAANMVMLGALAKKSNMVALSSVIQALKGTLKNQKLVALNEEALNAGFNLF